MTGASTGIPDLLRRFVPAPHRNTFEVNGAEITLHTDDLELVAALPRAGLTNTSNTVNHHLQITVIRDEAAIADDSDLTIVNTWPVATVILGAGTMFAVDCERHQVVGFLASRVSPQYFLDELLPLLISLSLTANPYSE